MGHIGEVLGGVWLVEPGDLEVQVSGVGIDSRRVAGGSCFVAIPGERFDGHDYTSEASTHGAVMGIVSREVDSCGMPLLRVPDTVAALQMLARSYRDAMRGWGCRVIAVTGSNGKTTTRQMIYRLLSRRYGGVESPASYNNHLGVPLTLLSVRKCHDFVVVELGSNHPGEISALGSIVRPEVGVVTSIGRAHIGHFGDIRAIAREKLSLLSHIEEGGLAVVPSRDCRSIGISPEVGSDIELVMFEPEAAIAKYLSLPGEHNVSNATAASVVGRWYGLGEQVTGEVLSSLAPAPGRLERIECGGGVTVLNDTYNANPDSMQAAISVLLSQSRGTRRCVAVLGDMYELGDDADRLHRMVGEWLACGASRPELVVLIGPRSQQMSDALKASGIDVEVFSSWSDAVPAGVSGLINAGDVVLLKASRAMGLERLIPAISRRFSGPAMRG